MQAMHLTDQDIETILIKTDGPAAWTKTQMLSDVSWSLDWSTEQINELIMAGKHFLSLGLPYQVVNACGGDLGRGHVKMYDVEAWMPSLGKYGELGSASYFHDFQCRRSGIRYKDKDGKIKYAHSLNATAVATPRILIAIVENYQQADGSVKIPEVLRKYMGGREFIK